MQRFFQRLFNPQPEESVLILFDRPHERFPEDNELWEERRQMALDWHVQLETLGQELGFSVRTASYPATGQNNGDLPERCLMHGGNEDGCETGIDEVLGKSHIVISLPEFSATAPLSRFLKKYGHLRIGSMPGFTRFMLETGMTADFEEIRRRCAAIQPIMQAATSAEVEFSTGHTMLFDLRFNKAIGSDGHLHHGGKCTNLPSGEVFKVPFEGKDNEPSLTAGEIPIIHDGIGCVLIVSENRIVSGYREDGTETNLSDMFGTDDPAARNIAEFAIGVNDRATICGEILQDEKALGFHWARGRSEHLGGTVGPEAFRDPKNIVHQDYVYPIANAPITVKKVTLTDQTGQKTVAIENRLLLI